MNDGFKRVELQRANHVNDAPDLQETEPILAETELSAHWRDMLGSGVSPFQQISECYGNKVVKFDSDFLLSFVEFYRNGCNEADELLQTLVNANADELGTAGIFELLLEREPESLEIIEEILSKCGESGVNHFVYCGGLYLIARYSVVSDLKLIISRLLHSVFRVELDYHMPVFPPITADDLFGDSNLDGIVEFSPVNIFMNLANGADNDVMSILLDSLRIAFTRTPAVVAFSPWLLESLEVFLSGDLAPVCIAALSRGLKQIPSCLLKKCNIQDMILHFIQSDVEKFQLVGMKLIRIFLSELSKSYEADGNTILASLMSSEIRNQLVSMARYGSLRVKEESLATLKKLMKRCYIQEFREFVEPEILDLMFEFFDAECGDIDSVLAGEKNMVLVLIDMMKIILQKYTFVLVDEHILANMQRICASLRNVQCTMDPEIARKAESLLVAMAPFWEDEK